MGMLQAIVYLLIHFTFGFVAGWMLVDSYFALKNEQPAIDVIIPALFGVLTLAAGVLL